MKPVLIAILFMSCTDFSSHNFVSAQTNNHSASEKVDTAKTKVYTINAKPDIFETAYFLGTKSKMDTFPISFYPVDIGQINIESGRTIASQHANIRNTAQRYKLRMFTNIDWLSTCYTCAFVLQNSSSICLCEICNMKNAA